MNATTKNPMAKLSCGKFPEVPDGVKINVFQWDIWWTCEVKGDTLCFPDGRGIIGPNDMIWVSGRTIEADKFANKLRSRGFRTVGVGDPDDLPGIQNPVRIWNAEKEEI